MSDIRRLTEIAEDVADMRATLDVLVERLGLEEPVGAAVAQRRERLDRSRLEIERSLGQSGPPG
jgi:hypothetical protein